ncbi:MAG TPA: hypothetical protein VFG30_10885, partial [Polyangiales bacterium]|nr:hypothetical protein [Polyangiales bacterium]
MRVPPTLLSSNIRTSGSARLKRVIPEGKTLCSDVRLGAAGLRPPRIRGFRTPAWIAAVCVAGIAVSWDESAHALPKRKAKARERTSEIVAAAPSGDFAMPRKWLPAKGRECIRKGRLRGFCQGPRRVPEPFGEAAEVAKKLKLGRRNDAARLLIGPPPTSWIVAAEAQTQGQIQGHITDARFFYPLENSRLLRGLGDARPGKYGGGPRGPRR